MFGFTPTRYDRLHIGRRVTGHLAASPIHRQDIDIRVDRSRTVPSDQAVDRSRTTMHGSPDGEVSSRGVS